MNYNKITTFNKLTLQRKTRSTLSISGVGGKHKQVQIEVRKKRVYMVQSAIQDPDHLFLKKLKNDNNQPVENKSLSQWIQNESSESSVQDEIHSILPDQTIKKKYDNAKQFNIKNVVKTQIRDQIHTKCPMTSNENQELNKNIGGIDHIHDIDSSSAYATKDNDHNNINDFHPVSVLETKSNDNHCKLNHERRYNSRTRSKGRALGKVVKQKRNNNRLHVDLISRSDPEEELCIPSKIHRNKRKQNCTLVQSFSKPLQTVTRNIVIGESISVSELSSKMSVKSAYMISVMMKLGVIANINQVLDQETAQLIIEEMGHNVVIRRENELEEFILNDYRNNAKNISINTKNHIYYKNRAPIVTIMGHVDHGKTSILDYIRSTQVAASESGGITQKIGAYSVNTNNGAITFLDTPGHEAFTKMRVRGMQLTDIVVLVVAADDGVMPQTIESIQHIQKADIPVIVAINKIDKLETNIDQIKHELNRYGLTPEEWGGNTQFVKVSAISGVGINDLLDAILLQSEMLELKVMHYGMAKAIVIESSIDKGRGPVITVLVREGILKCGNIILCGTKYGRIRAMYNEFGCDINAAGPSIPVKLLGLSGIPDPGEMVVVVRSEKKAREVAFYRQTKCREIQLAKKQSKSTISDVFDNINNTSKIPALNFIIKSNTQGSLEAICESLKKILINKITVKILSCSIGNITETDSVLASSANAIILGFNVKADSAARHIIELNNLDVRYYSVIYDLLNSAIQIMNGILTPKYTQKIIGLAKVHNIFQFSNHETIAGCIVIKGTIKSHKKIKIIRNHSAIYEGELESLRHFKNDVHEVKIGSECGIKIKNYNDICSGDIIEILDTEEVPSL